MLLVTAFACWLSLSLFLRSIASFGMCDLSRCDSLNMPIVRQEGAYVSVASEGVDFREGFSSECHCVVVML